MRVYFSKGLRKSLTDAMLDQEGKIKWLAALGHIDILMKDILERKAVLKGIVICGVFFSSG